MTIRQALSFGLERLTKAKLPHPDREAERLLCGTLNCSPAHLFTYPEQELSGSVVRAFTQRMRQRATRYRPIAYLLHHAEFCQLPLYVDERVLIPRVETEELVRLVADSVQKYSHPRIADIGTGSGAIILALASRLPQADCFASDLSPGALTVARKNAATLQLRQRIRFIRGAHFRPFLRKPIDVVVANLPYLTVDEYRPTERIRRLELQAEPRRALVSSLAGLGDIRILLEQIAATTHPPKEIWLEYGWRQTARLRKIARQLLPGYRFTAFNDQFDRERFAQLALVKA